MLNTKKMVPQESTAQNLLFEWLPFRILSTGSKVRVSLYSIINSTTEKYYSVAFNGHTLGFHLQSQMLEPPGTV